VMRSIADRGIAIIFITHRLDEVISASDNITILRDGKLAATRATRQTSIIELAELMIGRKGEGIVAAEPRAFPADAPVSLSVRNLCVAMPGEEVRGVTLDVKEGEILGIGGLAGQGKLGIPNGVMGLYPSTGEVTFRAKPLPLGDARGALDAGLAMVSEDRRGVGLLLDQSIEDNIAFNAIQIKDQYLSRLGPFSQKNGRAVRKNAQNMIRELDIRCTSPAQRAGTLSGGNQQKVCIARALALEPKFLFVSEPTRGIDIGAKKLVLNTLLRLNREQGLSIIMVSSELQELRSICDRIAIVSEGEIVDILSPLDSDADFGLAMSGIKPQKEGKAHE
jgi:simple sugar transport system ATP-binding protein